jgi:signal transduction histidine kinase
MAKLVAPDGVLFVINDTGPGQAEDEEKRRIKDKTNCK